MYQDQVCTNIMYITWKVTGCITFVTYIIKGKLITTLQKTRKLHFSSFLEWSSSQKKKLIDDI